MADINNVLGQWYEKFQTISSDCHLLCPKVNDEDEENYNDSNDTSTKISVKEKEDRIKSARERIEITYWNSLVFGFNKKDAGKWLENFTQRLDGCLANCADCILNWYTQRKEHLQSFNEQWDEEVTLTIADMLTKADITRVGQNLQWAKTFIEKIEITGTQFKKAHLGEHQGKVHISVYEALCCAPYITDPGQRTVFQYVFSRLQGKKYLRIGRKDPLPGMTYFLFDQTNEERRGWARENWKNIANNSLSEAQFDWAVSDGLIYAIENLHQREMSQTGQDVFLDIEQFWQAFEDVLRTFTDAILLQKVRNLELQPGSVGLYELLFRHMQSRHEGVVAISIRVLSTLLRKSPNACLDVIGDARPNVIADLFFSNNTYKSLLRQSLDACWMSETDDPSSPFPTSWIDPWLRSVRRDQRYDACEVLAHTLFENLAKDATIGEAGRAACMRSGLDALALTIKSFLDSDVKVGSGTTQLYANSAFNLVMKHKATVLSSLQNPQGDRDSEGWKAFKVGAAALGLIQAAMKLDVKLFLEEFEVLHDKKDTQSPISRDSKAFWQGVVEMYDRSKNQVELSEEILSSLSPLLVVEQLRSRKTESKSSDSWTQFNRSLGQTEEILASLLGSIAMLDTIDLNNVFRNRRAFEGIIALSLRGESDLSDAAAEAMKSWTEETGRNAALEQVTLLHSDQILGSMTWCLEGVLKPPWPWGPIKPFLSMSRVVLRGLTNASNGVLRTTTLEPKSAASVLQWWTWQWRFVSTACRNIESWSLFIPNAIMTEFCRDIMELAEALIAEDGLITSATSRGRHVADTMIQVLKPAKENFRGMENMIRLKDRWLVDVTVRVLCKILKRLCENELDINPESRKFIIDACVPTETPGKYARSTNLTDQQRAELLQALGSNDDDVQIVQIRSTSRLSNNVQLSKQKQSKLDAWSKAGPAGTIPSSALKADRTNRQDVLELSKSADSPLLRQLKAQQTKPKPRGPDSSTSALIESRKKAKAEKEKRDAEVIRKAKQIRGEQTGDGPAGFGLGGKDLSRSEIMVNSSDEESDDGDESDHDNQLANLGSGGKKTLDEAEKRQRKALLEKMRGPVKKMRQQRSAKDMRARLMPPMDKLHNAILGWDIFHTGNDPPGTISAKEVATKYPDPMSFQQTFFPLLISEAWRSFVTSKDEITAQPFGMKIVSRASVDSYLEATFMTPIAQNRERGISEGDILLVSEAAKPLDDPASKNCLARVYRMTYKKDQVEITYRVASRNNQMSSALTPGNSIFAVKITNMTPIEREYAALESLQYYDLMDEILKAEPSHILDYDDEKIKNWMRNWELNRGQALAVLGAQDNDGFTLIQGPPGTGKTKTIIAMVGALLTEQLAQSAANRGTSISTSIRPTNAAAANQPTSKKLLVCAPSNAAVDELVLRLKKGVTSITGKTRNINVLRLGRSDAINAAVKDVTLDELVRVRLEGDTTNSKAIADRDKLHGDAAKIKEALAILRPQLDQMRGTDDQTEYAKLTRRFEELKRQQIQIGRQIDADKDSGNSVAREKEMRRRQIQQEILNSAHVLCSTLSGSGHEMFRNLDVEFETVIIDEAAQCVELSALIPLKYGCCKCILVGDPKQLPPTVLSQSAARYGYNQSLFVRMQQNHPKSVHMLELQYRMHPEISSFPSKEFYEGQLRDGQDMLKLRRQPWHQTKLLGPYRFFDVEGVQERGHRGQSLVNVKELEVAMQMYERFSKDFQEIDLKRKIGIITPYKAQLIELRNRFKARYGEGITDIIEFTTTDAFQGRECEIIIFSCVRASSTGGIGFMNDIRRMNVGLTRAKSSLWILGDSRALVQGEFWRKLVEDARARDRYTKGDIVSMFRKPLVRVTGGESQGMVKQSNNTAQPRPTGDEDIVMRDATVTSNNHSPQPQTKAPGVNLLRRETPLVNRSSVAPEPKQNELTSRAAGPPVIHTSSSRQPSEPKKRPLSLSNEMGSEVKRITSDKTRGGLANKFGQRPNKMPRLPTDPAAMSVLGLVPPERPAAISNSLPSQVSTSNPAHAGITGSMKGPPAAGGSGTAIAKVDKQTPIPAPPPGMPRKKAKPNPFMPKKRAA